MQLADKLPALIPNDHYWLELLKKEFHFSIDEAKYLKEQMRANYEDVYKFCEADSFENFDQFMNYSIYPNYTSEIESINDELRKLDIMKSFDLITLHSQELRSTIGIPIRRPQPLTDKDTLLYERMKASNFEYSFDPTSINPRKMIMKVFTSFDIISFLRGRLWLRLEHAKYLINNHFRSMNKDNCISEIFKNHHQFSHFQKEHDQLQKKELFIHSVDEDTYGIVKDQLGFEINDLTIIQVKTCMILQGLGLSFSVDHLRNEIWFDSDEHIKALEYLMVDKKYSFITALAFLSSMKGCQVEALIDQIPLDELNKCANEYQVKAYIRFKNNGLTVERISRLHWFKDRYFLQTLIILVKYFDIEQSLLLLENNPRLAYCDKLENCLTLLKSYPLDKIIEIAIQLNTAQIECLMNKIDIKEIIGLNEVQANALYSLFDRGLRGKHLRGQDWFSCPYHKDVLCYLIRKYNFSVDNALEVIKQTSWLNILKIMKNLSNLDLGDLNHYHIMALLKLEHLGLKKQHLIGHAWFNNLKIKDELIYLISHEKKSAEEALAFLQQKAQQQHISREIKASSIRIA